MAEWETATGGAVPHFVYSIKYTPPEVIVHRFKDGKEQRVQNGSEWTREYSAKFSTSRATMTLMLEFFKLKGHLTTFSKIAWDPYEAGDAVTVNAKFMSVPQVDQVAKGVYHTTFKFKEVIPSV